MVSEVASELLPFLRLRQDGTVERLYNLLLGPPSWQRPRRASGLKTSSFHRRKLIICVASKDELRDRGVQYHDAVRESEWEGELSIFEVEGEGHGFHIFNPETHNAKEMFKRLAEFIQEC
ncbi:hypothetical protein L1887_38888 [Cichorium endivia]|nr:hypothetical protein L1887_38888 [Cichorium endivia]